MGNVGRSSYGCASCRKRKIRCDEAKPGCKRCAQIRKPCPGYPFQIQIDIQPYPERSAPVQDVRRDASGSPLKNRLGRIPLGRSPPSFHFPLSAKEGTRTIKNEEQPDSKSALLLLTKKHRPESPLRYDVQHQSICFFLNLFCFQAARRYSFPIIDFVPELISNAPPGSPIHLATTAVSRMTLADQYSGKDARLETGTEYGLALAATNKSIRNSIETVKDETLMAVWLLGLYEQVNAILMHGRIEAMSAEEEWQSHILHIRGALRLLQLRGLSQFRSARSEKMFRVFKAAIQLRLFILNSVTSKDFSDLEIDVYQDEHEFVPSKTANKASAFFLKTARHCEAIKHFLRRPTEDAVVDSDFKDALNLLHVAESMDADMEGWSKEEPGWDMMKIHGSTSGTMWALYPSHAIHYFYSFWVYLYWIRFLIARVKLYEALLVLVGKWTIPSKTQTSSNTTRDTQVMGYKTIIQKSASELIGLTAYALGDVSPTGGFNSAASGLNPGRHFQEINVVAALQLVIPLKTLQRSPHPTPTQKGAIDLAISHIGDGFRRQPLMFA